MVHFATCVLAGRVDEFRDVGKRTCRPGGRGRNDHTSRNFDHRGRCDGSFCDLCACRPAVGFGPITGVGKIAGMVNPVGGCNGRPAKSIPGIGEPGSPIFAGALPERPSAVVDGRSGSAPTNVGDASFTGVDGHGDTGFIKVAGHGNAGGTVVARRVGASLAVGCSVIFRRRLFCGRWRLAGACAAGWTAGSLPPARRPR